MIVILGLSLILTNLLGGITNLFTINAPVKYVKEGFESGDKCSSHKEKECSDVSGCSWKDNKCVSGVSTTRSGFQSLNPAPVVEETDSVTISQSFDKAQEKEKKHDYLEKLVGGDNIRNINEKTQALMGQQEALMLQMKDIAPLMQEALGAISNLGSGNYLDTFNSLAGKLDNFHEKYPGSFPKNYKEESSELKDAVNQITQANENLSKISSQQKES